MRYSPLLIVVSFVVGCAGVPGDVKGGSSGTITVKASGISGQSGKVYAVVVYAYDWSPGATVPPVGSARGIIDADPFSVTVAAGEPEAPVGPGGKAKVFAGGTYSVVFFVSSGNSPPEYFAEIRAAVDGDTVVDAPSWQSWTHINP